MIQDPTIDKTDSNMNGLIFILFVAILAGISSSNWYLESVSSKELPDLLFNVLFGIGLLTWISKDIEKFSPKPSKGLSGCAIIFPILTSFYYAFSRYGLKKGCLLSLKIIGFCFLCLACAVAPLLLLNNFF